MRHTPRVSVIIPAFNAAATLAPTLASALAQSYADLEIVVVDDGSTDATAEIATAFADRDPRVRVIITANGGVAKARNRGIAEARGELLAPLDADDLWHPEKIARQVETLDAAGPRVGLVYNWFRLIDGDGLVTAPTPMPTVEGAVLHRHLVWNFIGNGSAPLLRRSALPEEPYAPALRQAGNEGCEDYLLQLWIARRFHFACVPAYLTAYRKTAHSMSSNHARMYRSRIQVYGLMMPDIPPSARRIARRETARDYVRLGFTERQQGELGKVALSLARAALAAPVPAAGMARYMFWTGPRFAWGISEDASPVAAVPFESYAPDEPFLGSGATPVTPVNPRMTATLTRLDAALQLASP